MTRDRKDRSASWFMEHLGGSLLRLAPIAPVVAWQAAQTVLGYPKQIPDGLLDVTFAGKSAPDPFLIEIETYPDQDTLEQIRKDVAIVQLTRGVLPDVLLLVLLPKGNLVIHPEQLVTSAQGLTRLHLTIHVVNLWMVPAADLLAAGDVGLIPWVPLAHSEESPAQLLQMCRQRIDEQGKPEEKGNLLAMTRVMAEARYNDPELLRFLGGPIMTIEKVLLETPAGKRFIAAKEREFVEKAAENARAIERETVRKWVLRLLQQRFGQVPEDLAEQLRAIQAQPLLDGLHDVAAMCPDLEAFRKALNGL